MRDCALRRGRNPASGQRNGQRKRPGSFMPSEVIEGKRTFIERHGQVVERPFRHTVEFTDLGDGTTSVSLMALVQGSSFHLREVEEWRTRAIVHLGPELVVMDRQVA